MFRTNLLIKKINYPANNVVTCNVETNNHPRDLVSLVVSRKLLKLYECKRIIVNFSPP